MALQTSGPISLGDINVELDKSATAEVSLGDADVRQLLEVASGEISISDAYGKANEFPFTISSNQTNANLRTLAVNAGWNEVSRVIATVSSGVYISANSTGTYALTIDGSFPNGVEVINNGVIVGMGGAGGQGGGVGNTSGSPYGISGASGSAGGPALLVSVATSINNANTIAGGGGGGGGGAAGWDSASQGIVIAGGGGGGGRSGAAANSSGGVGGTAVSFNPDYDVPGDGNPGGTGNVSSAGAGGASKTVSPRTAGAGGAGGGWGAAGGGGGGIVFGLIGITGPYAGGAAGAAVVGNSNITWLATGTRLGAIT